MLVTEALLYFPDSKEIQRDRERYYSEQRNWNDLSLIGYSDLPAINTAVIIDDRFARGSSGSFQAASYMMKECRIQLLEPWLETTHPIDIVRQKK